ncbi:hypothetical protein [Paenibacillus sp. LHD-38]|uniref:hypothetical protein n=1 Tax=Paenibacillus sp. LHD-38 TaxID=3072143 RepID=UPI0028108159|nr:hypothetical protein [Paenibacillus sp. LHD-38]MDQ8733200.1 hypothetical protein [Paenibacillus sp. LHD-38]
MQKSIQRGKKATVKAGKKIIYAWWFEYPYWLSEKAMLRHVGSYERSYDPDKISQLSAARQRSELMGGRTGRRNSAKNRKNADY